MLVTRKQTVSNKPVNWLLIVAVFAAAFIQAHYHLHHLDSTGSSAHGHNIDLHLLTDGEGRMHHDIDATSFTAVPDDAVKSKSIIAPIILLTLVLVVLPVIQKQVRVQLEFHNTRQKRSIPHFTPLLRAPPLN